MPETLCYLNNAATSFPKPDSVCRAIMETLKGGVSSPGRGEPRLSMRAERILFEARERIARFVRNPRSENIIFTKNATESINIALKGLLKSGDHVLVSSMEHNALMRPLEKLAHQGIRYTKVPCDSKGFLDPSDLAKAIGLHTRLIALTHASNVTGTILPIREVGEIARERGILFLVDAAQSAGVLDIDVERDRIDLLACTGHKGLLGPQGTGFLSIREGMVLEPLVEGGTGSLSDSLRQPDALPDRLESGTQNIPGVAGLSAGVAFIEEEGLGKIMERERVLTQRLLDGLSALDTVEIFGPRDTEKQTAVVSFRVAGRDPGEIGDILDREYGIVTRVGLHCAPLAHQTIGTYPEGTVRVSPGYFTKDSEIDYFLDCLKKI